MSLNEENLCTRPAMKPPERGVIGPRLGQASRIIKSNFNRAVAEEGLFSGQHHIIMLLKDNEGLTVSQISKHLGITPSTVSVSIKRMEKAGFIAKRQDDSDARITRLYLTEKGMAAPEHIREKMDSQENKITRGMTEQEMLMLSDLLDKVIQNCDFEEDCTNA